MATAWPMPLPAPVTTATLPSTFMGPASDTPGAGRTFEEARPRPGNRSASHWVTSGQYFLWALELTERPMWPASSVVDLTSFEPTSDLRASLWHGGTR